MSYESTLAYIHAVKWQKRKPGLSRTRELLAALGNPEETLSFVHIAGTNGKGSTAAITASVLRAAGYTVGLYTSPYINRFNERVQVNGVPIGDDELEEVIDQIRPKADAMEDAPTEFELITALAFQYFRQKHCDIVVLEVGLGGTLDSTNVIPAPECAIITALGMDHVRELGPTLADIAAAKAGIIKPGTEVVSYGSAPEADAVIAAACAAQKIPLHTVAFDRLTLHDSGITENIFDFDGLTNLHLPLSGTYQPRNAATAITALRVLRTKGWNIPDEAIREGLRTVSWPGRFELLRTDPPFILDGSHNAHGMRATVESLRTRFPGEKCTFLMSVMADKDVDEMLSLILPLAKRFVTVTANNPRALPGEELARKIRSMGGEAHSAPSISDGLRDVLSDGGITCALGTLYFSGEVRQAFYQLEQAGQ